MTKIRIVAAVVDTQQLTLYKEDGEAVFIMQGDPRLKKVLDEVTPKISKGLAVTVDIGSAPNNPYHAFEDQSGGLIKFFKVAKQKIASLLGSEEPETTAAAQTAEPVEPMMVGNIPSRARKLSAA